MELLNEVAFDVKGKEKRRKENSRKNLDMKDWAPIWKSESPDMKDWAPIWKNASPDMKDCKLALTKYNKRVLKYEFLCDIMGRP